MAMTTRHAATTVRDNEKNGEVHDGTAYCNMVRNSNNGTQGDMSCGNGTCDSKKRNNGWLLPDPFMGPDGERITSPDQWPAQRAYLADMLQHRLYGTMPPAPAELQSETVTANLMWNGEGIYELMQLTIPATATPGGVAIRFTVRVCRPNRSGQSAPAIALVMPNYTSPDRFCGFCIGEEMLHTAVSRGYAIVGFEIDEAAPDDAAKFFDSPCIRAYPGYTWRALAVWAWMQSRVIDWLETCDWADWNRIVATGHSRFGKTALCCGLTDTRVAVTAPAGSGCGGMGSLRLQGNRFGEGIGHFERIGRMANWFPHWILPEAGAYGTPDGERPYRENELPFDANILAACTAPRGLIVVEGLDDGVANQFGTQVSWLAASEVYRFLGAPERCGIHYREGGHAYTPEDWNVVMDFCDATLRGRNVNATYKIRKDDDAPVGYDWSMPCQ
ncbi:hypothetical protein KIH79_06050 [Bifidobacterium sp. 82T10]|uniref:4-O-methyl-glucuronoyl methylesterase-like domain-containing protein n=1 Tax=Bifidobacterium miconis TaxID=2834435 RepID=A0ABS6WEQ4_9BIFI|nr:hypothetical protein [Bifidobacterium miconis]MBW3092513.1 hypothetical protein [Bifidobacterium miconis]